jgi:serine protease
VSTPDAPCLFSLTTLTNLGTTNPTDDDYSLPLSHPSFGTSFSSPLVAATAGLMKSVNPALTPAQLIARLKETARPFPTTDELGTTEICVVPAEKPTQDLPCICTTAVCGAGMVDAGAAVQAALRPAVLISVARSGKTYQLNGSLSAASTLNARSITTYAWSVIDATGGSGIPVITNADQAVASIPVPRAGDVTVQLVVTDSGGDSDSASVTLSRAGSDPEFPLPVDEVHRGGGSTDAVLLLLLGALLLARIAYRRSIAARN